MDTGLTTVVIFFILIFGALEITFVIIPAMVSSSKVRQTFRPEYDIPHVLTTPVHADQAVRMRSWYSMTSDSHRYIQGVDLDILPAAGPAAERYPDTDSFAGPQWQELPESPEPPVRDWKTINRTSWAIQRANEAVREANQAIREANDALDRAEKEGYEWIDQIAEMERLRLRRKQ